MMGAILGSWFGPVLYAGAVLLVLAAIGRSTVPRRERLPMSELGWRDALGNAAIGWRVLEQIGEAMYRARMRMYGL